MVETGDLADLMPHCKSMQALVVEHRLGTRSAVGRVQLQLIIVGIYRTSHQHQHQRELLGTASNCAGNRHTEGKVAGDRGRLN